MPASSGNERLTVVTFNRISSTTGLPEATNILVALVRTPTAQK